MVVRPWVGHRRVPGVRGESGGSGFRAGRGARAPPPAAGSRRRIDRAATLRRGVYRWPAGAIVVQPLVWNIARTAIAPKGCWPHGFGRNSGGSGGTMIGGECCPRSRSKSPRLNVTRPSAPSASAATRWRASKRAPDLTLLSVERRIARRYISPEMMTGRKVSSRRSRMTLAVAGAKRRVPGRRVRTAQVSAAACHDIEASKRPS